MKTYRIILFLLVGCLLIGSFSTALSGTDGIVFSDVNDLFGKKIEAVAKKIEAFGYKANSDNKTGIFKDVAWEFTNNKMVPSSVVAWFNTKGRDVTYFVYRYNPDSALLQQMRQSLTLLYGEPAYQAYHEEKNGNSFTITYESLTWEGNGITYGMGFQQKKDGSRGTLKDAEAGKCGYSITISQQEEEKEEPPQNTPGPAATPKPKATPKPVKVKVSVASVKIQDHYGIRRFYIRLKNNSKVTVDRVDFLVKGYNRYGEKITKYSIDTVNCYYDHKIKPGKKSRSDWYYTSFMLEEATKIKIAIKKYHTTNGKTVEVPDDQLKWKTFGK